MPKPCFPPPSNGRAQVVIFVEVSGLVPRRGTRRAGKGCLSLKRRYEPDPQAPADATSLGRAPLATRWPIHPA